MRRGIQLIVTLLFSTISWLNGQENMAVLSLSNELNTATASWNAVAPGTLSFQVSHGMILLEGTIDGVEGRFILDTGSPGLIVNRNPAHSDSRLAAYGPTGAVPVEEVQVKSFELGGLTYRWLNGLAINLSHLESAMHCSLGGLIGFELFKEFDLLIDYPNQVILALVPGEFEVPEHDADLEFPLEMLDHLPVVTVKIQGKEMHLGLDTGTGANILDASLENWIGEMAPMQHTGDRIRGLNQKARSVQSTWLWMGGTGQHLPEPTRFLITDLTPVQRQLEGPLDGLLGYSFFKNKKVLFSFSQQKIFVWH